jgi:alkylation response protein AidB-like acyl-CoA dehydrogenase
MLDTSQSGGLDFALGEMADTIRDTTAALRRDRIAPLAAKIDEEDWFPRELWPKWASSGCTASPVAEEDGGLGSAISSMSWRRRKWRGRRPRSGCLMARIRTCA